MKTFVFSVLLCVFCFVSCKKDIPVQNPDNPFDFPAVYVVNSASNSISVINLSDYSPVSTIDVGNYHFPFAGSMDYDSALILLSVPGIAIDNDTHTDHPTDFITMDATTGVMNTAFTSVHLEGKPVYSPDGTEIWIPQITDDGIVNIYDAETFSLLTSIPVGSYPSDLAFSYDSLRVFVLNAGSNTMSVIDAETKAVINTIPTGLNPEKISAGHDNYMYEINAGDPSVYIFDCTTLLRIDTIQTGFLPGGIIYNAWFEELWITNYDGGTAAYYYNIGGHWVKQAEIPTGAGASAIGFNHEWNKAWVVNENANTVSVIDAATVLKSADVPCGEKPIDLIFRYAVH